MNRWFVVALVVAVLGVVLALTGVALIGWHNRPVVLDTPDTGLEGLGVPDFTLVDQLGRPVDQSVFEGRATVLSFMFTNCTLVCPMLNGEMARLHMEAFNGTTVQQVSISVDPTNDTPEALKTYADRFGVDHERWRMLTGDEETILTIARDGLKFSVMEDTAEQNKITLPDGSTMSNILHPQRLILIGPEREVLGLYSYQDADQLAELEQRAKALAKKLR